MVNKRSLIILVATCMSFLIQLNCKASGFIFKTSFRHSNKYFRRLSKDYRVIRTNMNDPGDSYRGGGGHVVNDITTNPTDGSTESDNNHNRNLQQLLQPPPPKHHTITVCFVPHEEAHDVWADVTKARTILRDPGLYRWPPHANILYPFISFRKKQIRQEQKEAVPSSNNIINKTDGTNYVQTEKIIDMTVLQKLRNATRQCPPFEVQLDTLGTFGGKQRGVLWLYPRTFYPGVNSNSDDKGNDNSSGSDGERTKEGRKTNEQQEPLYNLYDLLINEFPDSYCSNQQKGQRFVPHITLSHFASLNEAKDAQEKTESWWKETKTYVNSFTCNEIYLLERTGDDGQFLRVATICLGDVREKNAGTSVIAVGEEEMDMDGIQIHDPKLPFPGMPLTEEEWVREERMKLKNRRLKGRKRGRGGGRRKKLIEKINNQVDGNDPRGPSRSTDTPEIIAAKRAARKEKRERLERERLEREQTVESQSQDQVD